MTEGADKCLCAFKAERKIRADEAEARRRAHALALRVEVQGLANQVADIRQEMSHPSSIEPPRVRLDTPASLQDWHLAAAHPPPIPAQIEDLILALRGYQEYVMGSWEPGDVYYQVEDIGDRACDLIKAIDSAYGRSTLS